jgi:membrane protein DedA with SNARE-associated domain
MEEFIISLTGGALENLNYFWIIVFMTIESSFIPFPSEVVMIPAAYMAAAEGEMSVPMIILCGTIGALFGALINYSLAYYLGRPIVYKFANSRFGHMCLIDQQKVEDAENYFYKHGVSATLIGRLIPAIRQLISIPAGLSKMNIWKFMVYTSIGAGVWNAVLVALGLFCHTLIDKDTLIAKISHYSHIIGYAALALVAAIIIFLIYKGAKNPKKK